MKMRHNKLTLLLAAAILIVAAGCYNDKYDKLYPATPNACDTTVAITYSGDIAPIIATNCFSPGNGCHDAVGSGTSGYDYQTSIIPLQLTASNGMLLGSINWLPGHNAMPKNGSKLGDCEINKITRWVHSGAPNN
jgi:hypothetical protein